MARGEPLLVPAAPQALFSMLSVWDLAGVCTACLENDRVVGGAWIVTADELVSYDRLIEVFAAASPKTLDVKRLPLRVIEAKAMPLPFPLTEHLVYSGARLRDALGWQFTPLAEGMQRTYAWYTRRHES